MAEETNGERLVRVETKIDMILDTLQPMDQRVKKLEDTRSWAAGWLAAAGASGGAVAWIVKTLGGTNP